MLLKARSSERIEGTLRMQMYGGGMLVSDTKTIYCPSEMLSPCSNIGGHKSSFAELLQYSFFFFFFNLGK